MLFIFSSYISPRYLVVTIDSSASRFTYVCCNSVFSAYVYYVAYPRLFFRRLQEFL